MNAYFTSSKKMAFNFFEWVLNFFAINISAEEKFFEAIKELQVNSLFFILDKS